MEGHFDMRGTAVVLGAILSVVVATVAFSQDSGNPKNVPDGAPIAAKIKADASKLLRTRVSPVIDLIIREDANRVVSLTTEQLALVHRLQDLTRAILSSWLLRDLDSVPPPSPAELEFRVANFSRVRDRICGEVEAIVYEGILDSEEGRTVRTATGGKPRALLPGRNGLPVVRSTEEHRSSAQLALELRMKSETASISGAVSFALLGRPDIKKAYPNGIEHLDPVRQAMARRDLPEVKLSDEQEALVNNLDGLVTGIWRSWLVRDLDEEFLPPRKILAARVWEVGDRVQDSLGAHAEVIMLTGVVAPKQAEEVLAAVWQRIGIKALLDPVMAQRLRLSGAQRERIQSLFTSKDELANTLSENIQAFSRFGPMPLDVNTRISELRMHVDSQKDEIDEIILSQILSGPQTRALKRILSGNEARLMHKVGKVSPCGQVIRRPDN
jgi:hypothetical protein